MGVSLVKMPLLIIGTFLIAAGGILYEIFLGALGSYIFGDSVRIFSLTAGVYMFSMGAGAFSIRHDLKNPLKVLLGVEVLLIFLHTLGPLIIWYFFISGHGAGVAFWAVLTLSGVLVGCEIPLILGLTREIEGSSDARINQVLAADYFGALAASLIFGYYLLPEVGLLGSAATSAVLEAVGGIFLVLFMRGRTPSLTKPILLLVMLGLAALFYFFKSDHLQRRLETGFYQSIQSSAEVLHSEWTGFSHLNLVEYNHPSGAREVALFLDRQFQWSTGDGLDQYHEALTIPAVEAFRESSKGLIPQNVLILGGGDAFAAHVLTTRYSIPSVDIVDIDPRISALAIEVPRWREAGGKAIHDPRVKLHHDDAFSYVFRLPASRQFDLVIFDLPDPRNPGLARFFTPYFFNRLLKQVSERGVISIQSSSNPQQSNGKFRYVCSLLRLLADVGLAAEPLIGDELDFYLLGSRPPLQFPAEGKSLPGSVFKNSNLIAEYRVDPSGYFDSEKCKNEKVNHLLAPKLLDF